MRSSDGYTLEVEVKTAMMCITVRDFIELFGIEQCYNTPIPVSQVPYRVLEKTLVWCRHHRNDKLPTAKNSDQPQGIGPQKSCNFPWDEENVKRRDDIPDWDVDFMGTDLDEMYELLNAANYLNIPGLYEIGCKTVAECFTETTHIRIRKQIFAFVHKLRRNVSHEIARSIPNVTYITLFNEVYNILCNI